MRPARLLQALLPLVEPLYSRRFFWLMMMTGLLGLFLVSRQWDAFGSTFLYFFTPVGLAVYLLALVLLKLVHELGHALTAVRYGCRVPTMGVALLVLYPVLYTDTTDAYRLTSRRARLHIGAAGMLAETYLGLLCLLLWGLLPEGVLRSTVFVIATVNVSLTFLVNLNPFMRFDGYYLLSDWLGIPNLQERSFQLGRWRLREWLFGLGDKPPEVFKPRLRRALVLYAWATWLYRLVLLTLIALLVYNLFFKLLGILLFAAEIAIFIALPVARELRVWWNMRQRIFARKRTRLSLVLAVGFLLMLLVPWDSSLRLPAILRAESSHLVIAPAAGRVESVHMQPGQWVSEGEVLLRLHSPYLDNQVARLNSQLAAVELRLQRVAADRDERIAADILFQQRQETRSQLAATRARQEQLGPAESCRWYCGGHGAGLARGTLDQQHTLPGTYHPAGHTTG